MCSNRTPGSRPESTHLTGAHTQKRRHGAISRVREGTCDADSARLPHFPPFPPQPASRLVNTHVRTQTHIHSCHLAPNMAACVCNIRFIVSRLSTTHSRPAQTQPRPHTQTTQRSIHTVQTTHNHPWRKIVVNKNVPVYLCVWHVT